MEIFLKIIKINVNPYCLMIKQALKIKEKIDSLSLLSTNSLVNAIKFNQRH